MPEYGTGLDDWMSQAPPLSQQPSPTYLGKPLGQNLTPYVTDPGQQQAAQDAAEAAAARVKAPYAKANARTSGLPQALEHYGESLGSILTAPKRALTGEMQVNDPETNMPTKEAMGEASSLAGILVGGGMPMAERGALGMAGGKLKSTIDPDYVYHATTNGKLANITKEGLTPGTVSKEDHIKMWGGEGQGRDRTFFTGSEHHAIPYMTGDPDAVLLRVGRDKVPELKESYGGRVATTKQPIDSQHIEIKRGDKWEPLKPEDKTGGLSDMIKAYHGSPHDFDRFDLSKIGTGEGAQAYGHGLYFAENEKVAKEYRDTLSHFKTDTVNGEPYDVNKPLHAAARFLKTHEGDRDVARSQVRKIHGANSEVTRLIDSDAPIPDLKPAGSMYHVAIKANPDHFLDWDKPLSEQHPKVQEAIEKVWKQNYPDSSQSFKEWSRSGASKKKEIDLGYHIEQVLKDPKSSQKFREAGIPGIKYADQGSRLSDETRKIVSNYGSREKALEIAKERLATADMTFGYGADRKYWSKVARELENPETRNFVVFDDKLIDILKKYGIAGIGALPAMNAFHHQSKDGN